MTMLTNDCLRYLELLCNNHPQCGMAQSHACYNCGFKITNFKEMMLLQKQKISNKI